MSGTSVLPVVCTLLALSSWIGRTVSGQADFYPFGLPEGDALVPEADDGSSPEIHLQQSFAFFGDHYTQLYVSTNGVVSFGGNYTFCCNARRSIPISPAPPLLSPFWHDIDIRQRSGDILYRQTSAPVLLARAASEIMLLESGAAFSPTLLFIVTYDHVAPFSLIDVEETSSFQAVLATDGEGSSAAIFLYGDIGWGDSATVGFNAGDGVRYFEVAGSETNQTLTFNLRSNVGIPGTYVFSTDFQGVLFQVRLMSIGNCTRWINPDNTTEQLGNFVGQLEGFIATTCGCSFSITDAAFQCFEGSEDAVTFRARITIIEGLSGDAFQLLADLVFTVPLPLDTACSPFIDSFSDPECGTTATSTAATITAATSAVTTSAATTSAATTSTAATSTAATITAATSTATTSAATTSAATTNTAATSTATTSTVTTSTAAASTVTTSTAATEPTEAMDATETRPAASQSLPIIILAVVLGVVVILSVLIIVSLIAVILKQRRHKPVSHTPVLHNNQSQRKEEQSQAPINSYESRELHHTSVQSPIGVGPCVAYAKTEHSDQLHEEDHMYDVVRDAGEHAQYPRAIYEVPEDQK